MGYETNDAGDSDTPDRTTDAETHNPDQTMDAETHPTTVRHDWTQSVEPSVALVEAVAVATDRTTTALPPLQRSIDPDALDALLTRKQSSPVTVSFRYADTVVLMNGNGSIEIQIDGRPTEKDD